jgi:hypothetical protein
MFILCAWKSAGPGSYLVFPVPANMSQRENETYETQWPYETQFWPSLPSSPVRFEDVEMEIRTSKECSRLTTLVDFHTVCPFAILAVNVKLTTTHQALLLESTTPTPWPGVLLDDATLTNSQSSCPAA